MKKIRHLLLTFLCLLLIIIPNTFVQASEDSSSQVTEYHATASITAQNGLNVRSGPDKSYNTLGQLAPGTQITITGKTDNGWYQIDYNSQKGFVSSKYVSDPIVVEDAPLEDENEDTFLPLSNLSIVDGATLPMLIGGILLIIILMLITLVQLFQLTGKIQEYESDNDYEEYEYEDDEEYESYEDEYEYDDYDEDDDY